MDFHRKLNDLTGFVFVFWWCFLFFFVCFLLFEEQIYLLFKKLLDKLIYFAI